MPLSGQQGWPWPNPDRTTCRDCGQVVKTLRCSRCSAEDAYALADHAQRAGELISKCVHEEVDPQAYGSACADRDVALALLSQERRKSARLEAKVGTLQAQVDSYRAREAAHECHVKCVCEGPICCARL